MDCWFNTPMHRQAVRRIWRGLGFQNASQNHTLGTKMLGRSSFWAVLAAVFPQNGVSEGPEIDFGALRSRFGRLWAQLFWYFASFLSIFCIIWTNFPHEFLAACMDFQCPLAPQSLFSNIHLPRAPASSRPRRDSRSVNNPPHPSGWPAYETFLHSKLYSS